MKKKFLFVMIFTAALSAFAEEAASSVESKAELINSAFDSVMCQVNDLVTENASCLNVYSDAYIGKVWPAYPPHFGVNFTACGSFFDTSDISSLVETFQKGLTVDGKTEATLAYSIPKYLPMPTAALAARIGGLKLPFDIGLFGLSTFNLIKDCQVQTTDFGFDLITLGIDVRYCVLNMAKPPKISIGAGYSFTKSSFSGNMSYTSGSSVYAYPVIVDDVPETRTISGKTETYCDAALSNYTNTWFVQVQLSKRFGKFIPFGGYRVVTNYYSGKYSWNYKIDFIPDDTAYETANVETNSSNGDRALSKNGFSVYNQLFLGCGIQAGYFQFNLSGQWNINTNYISAALNIGFRM